MVKVRYVQLLAETETRSRRSRSTSNGASRKPSTPRDRTDAGVAFPTLDEMVRVFVLAFDALSHE